MKKKKIIITGIMVSAAMISVLVITSCIKRSEQKKTESPEKIIRYYTCPMHPQVHKDHPGECPICGMRLVPVYQETSPNPLLRKEGTFMISPERQQLIGLRTETVTRQAAIREIRTVGRVAFDPELATAQREFMEISQNVPSLRSAAISHLKLLGMSDGEIRDLEKRTGNSRIAPTSLYLPGPNDPIWIYATLYEGEMDLVKPGMKAIITLPQGPEKPLSGLVRSLDPVVNPMTRSIRARIEIPKAGGQIRPDSFVNVSLQVDLGEALLIPKSALIDTGTRKVVFVVDSSQNFQSRDIKTGPEAGKEVIVLEGLQEGEKVVSSAAFLVDSESSLKTNLSQSPTPGCPEGQVWDLGMSMCMPKVGS